MSSAIAGLQKKSRKKKLIAILTLILLLLLVSLLGGLSSQMSSSDAKTGFLAGPTAAPPGNPELPVRPPQHRPLPMLALAGPPPTPAEEILMQIARYGGSATDATRHEIPVVERDREPSPVPAPGSVPDPPASSPAPVGGPDYPWPTIPRPDLPMLLPLPDEDCCNREDCPPCDGNSPCPDNPPEIAGPGPGEWYPPSAGPGPDDFFPDGSGVPPLTDEEGVGEAAPVPEPATLFLVGSGLACLAHLGRRGRSSS